MLAAEEIRDHIRNLRPRGTDVFGDLKLVTVQSHRAGVHHVVPEQAVERAGRSHRVPVRTVEPSHVNPNA